AITGNSNMTAASTSTLAMTSSTGTITVNGIAHGSGSITFTTNGSIIINGNITGTRSTIINPATTSTTWALGDGQTGTISISKASLERIMTTGASGNTAGIIIGATNSTGVMRLGAITWKSWLQLNTRGVIT